MLVSSLWAQSFESVDLPYISRSMGGVITKIWYYVFDYTTDQQQQKDSDCHQEFGDANSDNDNANVVTGLTRMTDNVNKFWRVDEDDIASNATVTASATPMEWNFWDLGCENYVFGKTYYIFADDDDRLKLTTDWGTPTASTTDKRVFKRVYVSQNDVYTFKTLNSDLYAGQDNGNLALVDDENATCWEMEVA